MTTPRPEMSCPDWVRGMLWLGLVVCGCGGGNGPAADRLSFSTTVGVDPAPQTFALPSGGIAGISWVGWADQPWLSLDPGSGDLTESGPVNVSVTVRVDGLAAGTFQGNATFNTDIRKTLPADGECAGWNRCLPPVPPGAIAPAQAQLQGQLFDQIDGAGMLYIDHGWVESIWQSYTDGQQILNVTLSDMGTSANARAMYDEFMENITGPSPIDVGDAAVVETNLAGRFELTATRGKFLLEAKVDAKTAPMRSALEEMATIVVAGIDALGSVVAPLIVPVDLTVK